MLPGELSDFRTEIDQEKHQRVVREHFVDVTKSQENTLDKCPTEELRKSENCLGIKDLTESEIKLAESLCKNSLPTVNYVCLTYVYTNYRWYIEKLQVVQQNPKIFPDNSIAHGEQVRHSHLTSTKLEPGSRTKFVYLASSGWRS